MTQEKEAKRRSRRQGRQPSWPGTDLIRSGEEYAAGGGATGDHAAAGLSVGRVEGDAADGGLGLVLDALLGLGCAVPVGHDEEAFLDLKEQE